MEENWFVAHRLKSWRTVALILWKGFWSKKALLSRRIIYVYVVVNFLFQLIFIFPLFWVMVMYANEFKTKEKQKLTEIKN